MRHALYVMRDTDMFVRESPFPIPGGILYLCSHESQINLGCAHFSKGISAETITTPCIRHCEMLSTDVKQRFKSKAGS